MEKQINRLNSEITNLQNEVEKLRTVNTNKINQYSAEVVLKCKKVLETYVYPDLCNEILQKEGLDGMFGQNINPSSLESDVLYPDMELDVQKLENCTSDENLACINDLLGGFDDE